MTKNIAVGLPHEQAEKPEVQPPIGMEKTQPTPLIARELIETILLTFFIFWLVHSLVGRYRIDGHSMNPTLYNEQYLIINNFSYYLDEPEHGDVIVFIHPNTSLNLIKRVIGVPGDTILLEDGDVYVNGTLLNEPYIKAPATDMGSWTVAPDSYFVMGDNRNNSSDSREWSFLPEDNILGKAQLVYWPPRDWLFVPHYDHIVAVQETE